jgi:ribose transport system ATP-binding protein
VFHGVSQVGHTGRVSSPALTDHRADGVEPERLDVRRLGKTFGRYAALSDVSLKILPGELHALVGENGSGKSTLVKVLSGYHAPDPGSEVSLNGQLLPMPIRPGTVGLSVVHQTLGLVDDASVLENLRVGRFRPSRLVRRISWKNEATAAQPVLDRLGCTVNLQARVRDLSAEDRTAIAIARAMQGQSTTNGLIVFDESTAALTRGTLQRFYEMLETILRDGTAVLLVSHRLEEVVEVADKITVLRDGMVVETGLDVSQLSTRDIARLMLGRELGRDDAATYRARTTEAAVVELPGAEPVPADPNAAEALAVHPVSVDPAAPAPAAVALVVRGCAGTVLQPLDLELCRGEIVGVTGLVGSGFEELPYVLAGASASASGSLQLGGRVFTLGSDAVDLLDAGVALVPQDRAVQGLVGEFSVMENVTLPQIGRRSTWFFMSRDWQRRMSQDMINRLGVKPPRLDMPVANLSGGNQQKVLLAKWLATQPDVLLMHEPTQAVDVGARVDIHDAIRTAAAAGAAVLVATGDEQELVDLCDRVLIFSDGRPIAELRTPFDAHELLAATLQSGERKRLRGRERS